MKTLAELTESLKALGVTSVRTTRSYKRRGHREVLIEGWVLCDFKEKKERTAAVNAVIKKFVDTIDTSWYFSESGRSAKIECTFMVQLPAEY